MIDNFSWVIRDKLAGSAIPDEAYSGRISLFGAAGTVATDLADLYGRGIRCLVSLTGGRSGLALLSDYRLRDPRQYRFF